MKKKKATEKEQEVLGAIAAITNEKVRSIMGKNKITREKPSFYKTIRNVILAGTAAGLIGLLSFCGINSTYQSLSQRTQPQPEIRTAQIYKTTQEQTGKTIETIVESKEGEYKVFFYEGDSNLEIPETAKYTIQKGDRLWSLAKALNIDEKEIPSFVNELVDKQKEYENDESFLERISQDKIYVSKGKIDYRKNVDGIKGDSLEIGDEFYIDQSLVEKYGGDFEKAKELGKLIVKEKPVKEVTKKVAKEIKVKESVKQKQQKEKQEGSKETVGLYMQEKEKPFGIFQKDVANDTEKYYEKLSGQDIEQKSCSYSTPLSIKLPAKQTQRVTENYIKARLGKNMNMDVMEAYSLLDNLKVQEKRQFVKDFKTDFEKAKNEIQRMYKQGKNIEQITQDSEYTWVDEGFVKSIVKYN